LNHETHEAREIFCCKGAKAQRLLRDALAQRHWTDAELRQRAKADPTKRALTRRLRSETTMTRQRIADYVHTCTGGYAANVLRQP
jgi:hypothetical protein